MNLGVKILDAGNWKEPELPLLTNGLEEADWVGLATQPKLSLSVPGEIHALFEVARAAFVYSWFYVPLTQLGADQCHRVVEAAVREKCKQVGIAIEERSAKGKTRATTFSKNIEELLKRGAISSSQKTKLNVTRSLRNHGSHPQSQDVLPPGFIIGVLRTTAETINSLF